MSTTNPQLIVAIGKALQQSYAFAQASEAELQTLAQAAEWLSHRGEEILLREGQSCDSIYVLVSGRLVVKEMISEDSELIIARIKPGDMVGEMGFLSQQAASATVRTDGPSEVVRIGYQALRSVFNNDAAMELKFQREVSRTLTERLRKGNRDLRLALMGSVGARL